MSYDEKILELLRNKSARYKASKELKRKHPLLRTLSTKWLSKLVFSFLKVEVDGWYDSKRTRHRHLLFVLRLHPLLDECFVEFPEGALKRRCMDTPWLFAWDCLRALYPSSHRVIRT